MKANTSTPAKAKTSTPAKAKTSTPAKSKTGTTTGAEPSVQRGVVSRLLEGEPTDPRVRVLLTRLLRVIDLPKGYPDREAAIARHVEALSVEGVDVFDKEAK